MARARASLAFRAEFTPVHCPLLHVLLSSCPPSSTSLKYLGPVLRSSLWLGIGLV